MSPLDEPIPEGFGRIEPSLEKSHTLQTFVFRCTDANGTYKKFYPNCIPELLIFEIKDFFAGSFPQEFVVHLPVRNLLSEPTQLTIDLVPVEPASTNSN